MQPIIVQLALCLPKQALLLASPIYDSDNELPPLKDDADGLKCSVLLNKQPPSSKLSGSSCIDGRQHHP
jgi:hypothetical protein